MGFVVVSPQCELARKSICIVISGAQNLRARTKERAVSVFSQNDDNFSSSYHSHARMYVYVLVLYRAKLYFRYADIVSVSFRRLIVRRSSFSTHDLSLSFSLLLNDLNREFENCMRAKRIERMIDLARGNRINRSILGYETGVKLRKEEKS